MSDFRVASRLLFLVAVMVILSYGEVCSKLADDLCSDPAKGSICFVGGPCGLAYGSECTCQLDNLCLSLVNEGESGSPCTGGLRGLDNCEYKSVNEGNPCEERCDGSSYIAGSCAAGQCGAYITKDCTSGANGCLVGTCDLNSPDHCTFVPDNTKCTAPNPLYWPEGQCWISSTCSSDGSCGNHIYATCVPQDDCHTVKCDPSGGCIQTPITCPDDGDPCTLDICSADGGCTYPEKANCCRDSSECTEAAYCQVGTCDNGNACVYRADSSNPECCNNSGDCPRDNLCKRFDACAGNVCQYSDTTTAVSCGNGDLCNNAYCEPSTGQCVDVPVPCNPSDSCHTAECDSNTGVCIQTRIPSCCSISTDCYVHEEQPATCNVYECDNGQCAQVRIPAPDCCLTKSECEDDSACTTDACDESNSCTHTPVSDPYCCDTVDDCRAHTCYDASCGPEITNRCQYSRIQPLSSCCLADSNCDDVNKCTIDTCDLSDNSCSHTAVDCDDGNLCTTDTCAPSVGCEYATTACSECTKGYCYWANGGDEDCDKSLLGDFPTSFCGKTEAQIFAEAVEGNNAQAILLREYLIVVNNRACRNNAYSKWDTRQLEYARDLLLSTCDPIYPCEASGCDCDGDAECEAGCGAVPAENCDDNLFGVFVSAATRIDKYTVKNYCEGEKEATCQNLLLKLGDEPAPSYLDVYKRVMLAAGYTYDDNSGMWLAEGEQAPSEESAPVVWIVLGFCGFAGVVALIGFFGYKYGNRFSFMSRGGDVL